MNSENKYKNAKIYSIRCSIDDNLIYIGSTCQLLYKRWYDHKIASTKEHYKNMQLYIKMNELRQENFYIELVINCPCENKEELNKIEGEYIRKLGTLNKRIEGRTDKDYKEDNKAKIQEYYKQNQEKILNHKKQYREANIEKFKNKDIQYYNTNKDIINSKKSVSFTCNICNCSFRTGEKSRHLKTKKHMKNINSNNEENYV